MAQTSERTRGGRAADTAEPTVVVGSAFGTVTALHARTGAVTWQRPTGQRLGNLIQADAIVYAPTTHPIPSRMTVEAAARRWPERDWSHGQVHASLAHLMALPTPDLSHGAPAVSAASRA